MHIHLEEEVIEMMCKMIGRRMDAESRFISISRFLSELLKENFENNPKLEIDRLKALCYRESEVLKEALKRPKNNKSMIEVVVASLAEFAPKES